MFVLSCLISICVRRITSGRLRIAARAHTCSTPQCERYALVYFMTNHLVCRRTFCSLAIWSSPLNFRPREIKRSVSQSCSQRRQHKRYRSLRVMFAIVCQSRVLCRRPRARLASGCTCLLSGVLSLLSSAFRTIVQSSFLFALLAVIMRN